MSNFPGTKVETRDAAIIMIKYIPNAKGSPGAPAIKVLR